MRSLSFSERTRGAAIMVFATVLVLVPAVLIVSGAASQDDSTDSDAAATLGLVGASGLLRDVEGLTEGLLSEVSVPGEIDAAPGEVIPSGSLQIPAPSLSAYRRAEQAMRYLDPECGLSWSLVAGIGKVSSDHGAGLGIDPSGTTVRPILGPRLDGSPGIAAVPDTDQGQLDRDDTWDRAAGPLQIIPSVWERVGADSNGDRVSSPHNVYDAALGAGRYLCDGSLDLNDPVDEARAVFRYLSQEPYVRSSIAWSRAYTARLQEAAPGAVPPAPGPPLPAVEDVVPLVAQRFPVGSAPGGADAASRLGDGGGTVRAAQPGAPAPPVGGGPPVRQPGTSPSPPGPPPGPPPQPPGPLPTTQMNTPPPTSQSPATTSPPPFTGESPVTRESLPTVEPPATSEPPATIEPPVTIEPPARPQRKSRSTRLA